MRVDVRPLEHVAQHGAQLRRFARVQQRVHPGDRHESILVRVRNTRNSGGDIRKQPSLGFGALNANYPETEAEMAKKKGKKKGKKGKKKK